MIIVNSSDNVDANGNTNIDSGQISVQRKGSTFFSFQRMGRKREGSDLPFTSLSPSFSLQGKEGKMTG